MRKGSVIPASICRILHEVNKVTISIMVIPHVQGLELPLRRRGQMWITEHLGEFGNKLSPVREDTGAGRCKKEGLEPGCRCLSKKRSSKHDLCLILLVLARLCIKGEEALGEELSQLRRVGTSEGSWLLYLGTTFPLNRRQRQRRCLHQEI